MTVITSAILKVASRCNLNCTYCYMYNLVDQSYKLQPKTVAYLTIDNTFKWIQTHCRNHKLKSFHLILHGGEPLLAGKEKIRYIGMKARRVKEQDNIRVSLSLLTNSILLDKEWLDIFNKHDIGFSISIDGPIAYHDRFRLNRNKEGSHGVVEKWIKYLISHPSKCPTFGKSALTVIHPDMDGKVLIRYFYALGLKKIDFLLPDQNHNYGSIDYPKPDGTGLYSKVLTNAYREWRMIDDPSFKVRKFDLLILSLLGVPVSLDSIGNGPIKVFTIETNGEIEAVDSMKVCGDHFTKSGININDPDYVNVEHIPLIKLGIEKDNYVHADCMQCTYYKMCGGGYLPHRFHNGNFTKTVYCADMLALCELIHEDVNTTLDRALENSLAHDSTVK